MQCPQKRSWLIALVIAATAAMLSATPMASARAGQLSPLPPACKGNAISLGEFRPFSAKVWDKDSWKRGKPPRAVISAQRKKLKCAAGPGHQAAMQTLWQRDKGSFYQHRKRLKRLFINYTWQGAIYPESSWFSLPELKPYVAAALAEAAGDYTGTNMPGWTMVQMSKGEGHLKPGSRSTDCGYGWLAITCPYGDEHGVPEMGGYGEMLNPVKNAYVAARMYGAQGFSAWHGDQHVANWNLHYTGKFDIRDALGGLTFGQALRAG